MNRRQRRIEAGINKRGMYNPKKKGALMLFMGKHNQCRFKMYTQQLPGGKEITHTVEWPKTPRRKNK